MAKPIPVFHIPGRFAHERLEDHEVESKAEADRLVATSAFALTAAEAKKQAHTSPASLAPEPEE
jgi:hypothetical protein